MWFKVNYRDSKKKKKKLNNHFLVLDLVVTFEPSPVPDLSLNTRASKN